MENHLVLETDLDIEIMRDTGVNIVPLEHSDMATIEHHLHKWAAEADKVNRFNEANVGILR